MNEVIRTGREASVQDLPIAVVAFTGEELDARRVKPEFDREHRRSRSALA